MPAAAIPFPSSCRVTAWWPRAGMVASWVSAAGARSPSSVGCSNMNEADKAVIEQYADTLLLEEGLSANTLDSYRSDLEGFARWLASRRQRLLGVSHEHVREYLSARTAGGARARTS